MLTYSVFAAAALAEIAGCFAFWAWLRLDKSPWWLAPGMLSWGVFAYLLTLAESEAAGRAYAAYGGIYIVAAIIWLWGFEGHRPDRWDIAGGVVCLLGSALILFAPRGAYHYLGTLSEVCAFCSCCGTGRRRGWLGVRQARISTRG